MNNVNIRYIDEKSDLLTDLGSVSSKQSRANYILKKLKNNYQLYNFEVHKNNYNGGYNIYVDELNLFKIWEFRGFMRGVIVGKNWLE